MGKEGARPLPLWIKPDKKISVREMMELMRDHFEDSPMDLHQGLGAGPYRLPYRWRPLFWEVEGGAEGAKYFNERSTSTQQTGFSFISQMRSSLPDPIGGLIWFSVDDTNSAVYVPMYSGIRKVPKPYAVGTGSFYDFTWESAFWTFNAVSNFAYLRYCDMIKDIKVVQRKLEGSFVSMQPAVEQAALKLYREAPELARDYLTRYSARQAGKTVTRWRKLWEQLLLKYLDGNVRDELGKVTHPGYSKEWYQRIVKETGDQFLLKKIKGEPETHDQPKGEPVAGGYFHSREELGTWIAQVPTTLDFRKEKLMLLPGSARCGQPPRCCLKPELDRKTGKLTVTVPTPVIADGHATDKQQCGEAGWMVRVPVKEKRPIVLEYQKAEGH
jgi:dipeptidase